MFRKLLLVGMALMLVALAGCGQKSDGTEGTGETTVTDESPTLGMVAPPGIYDLPAGTTQALGILVYRDLEGGFWAVAKTAVPEQAETAETVAVIVASQEVAATLESLRGEYVSVIGVRSDGPSIYMAGPVIEAQTVERVSDLKE